MTQAAKNIALFIALSIMWSCSSNINVKDGAYSPPSIKSQERLIFPVSAQQRGVDGVTKVFISITEKGEVKDAKVMESSGYEDLDEAAVSYCKKLSFFPAMHGDVPVSSYVKLKVNFDYKNYSGNSDRYVQSVLTLYDKIERAGNSRLKTSLQKELFETHINFIGKMGGEIKFNSFAKEVIQKNSLPEWGNIWDSYPLTFLLFHDFLQRYPDCEFSTEVRAELTKALRNDIYFIENSPALDAGEENFKEGLLLKIKSFVSRHYPGIKLSFGTLELNS